MKGGFPLRFASPWQKAGRSFGSPNPSTLKAAILSFLLDGLLSVPLFRAWTSTQDECARVLFGDRPDGCSVTPPATGSCNVDICHVPPSRGCKRFLVRLLPALRAVSPSSLSRGSGASGNASASLYLRLDPCHTLPTTLPLSSIHKFLFGGLVFAATQIWFICLYLSVSMSRIIAAFAFPFTVAPLQAGNVYITGRVAWF